MSVALSDEKNELIKNVAEHQGFKNYKIEVKAGSMKGDGYLGIINTIDIEDNVTGKTLHLIMKSAMSSEKLRENAPVRKAYEREIHMYKTIFPTLTRFSEENGIKTKFTETAKCYGTLFVDKEECIILENLKEIDFKLWNRKLPMNEDHVSLVFKTYAKLHGTSLALKTLQPEKFEELSKNLVNIFQKEDEKEADIQKFAEGAKQVFENGFKAIAGNDQALQVFTNFAQNCMTFFKDEIRKQDKYSCILHGDCWCNNMMFRYRDVEDPSKPTEMCLLDWQISHVGSPILDLSYFFYACSSKEVLYGLPKYLDNYHQILEKILMEAGLNTEEIMTRDELTKQWKKFSKYGLFMSLFVMNIVLSEVEEAPDLSELANSGKNILESLSTVEFTNAEAANKRIADIIIFMTENGFL